MTQAHPNPAMDSSARTDAAGLAHWTAASGAITLGILGFVGLTSGGATLVLGSLSSAFATDLARVVVAAALACAALSRRPGVGPRLLVACSAYGVAVGAACLLLPGELAPLTGGVSFGEAAVLIAAGCFGLTVGSTALRVGAG